MRPLFFAFSFLALAACALDLSSSEKRQLLPDGYEVTRKITFQKVGDQFTVFRAKEPANLVVTVDPAWGDIELLADGESYGTATGDRALYAKGMFSLITLKGTASGKGGISGKYRISIVGLGEKKSTAE